MEASGYVRITDLGISREWSPENSQDTSGTPGYMAPEIMKNQKYDYKGITKNKILIILRSILRYIDQSISEVRHPFHVTYHMYNIFDNNFTPKNIIKILQQDISNVDILNNIKPKKALELNKNRRYVLDFKKYLSKSNVR